MNAREEWVVGGGAADEGIGGCGDERFNALDGARVVTGDCQANRRHGGSECFQRFGLRGCQFQSPNGRVMSICATGGRIELLKVNALDYKMSQLRPEAQRIAAIRRSR